MDEVPRAFAISDTQSFPMEMKGRVYTSCVRSIMTYGSETRPLLVDFVLKFKEQRYCLRERQKDKCRIEKDG